jgi:hypothetical protein
MWNMKKERKSVRRWTRDVKRARERRRRGIE